MIRITKIIDDKEIVEPEIMIVAADLVALDKLTYTGVATDNVDGDRDTDFEDKPCLVAYFDGSISAGDIVYFSVMDSKKLAEVTENVSLSFNTTLETDVNGISVKTYSDISGEIARLAIQSLRADRRVMLKYEAIAFPPVQYSEFLPSHTAGLGSNIVVGIMPIERVEDYNNMHPFAWVEKAGFRNRDTGEFIEVE